MNRSASGAKKYYSEAYYNEGRSAQLDYYSDKDESIGKWGGLAAEKLGLAGDISKGDFALLCDNINPVTGNKLTGRNDSDRTVGYDLTFNASKSVSLAYSFGNDNDKREILNAFRSSVADTMREVEIGMQARVRDKGKNENRETCNIAYGEFIHFTTRPIRSINEKDLNTLTDVISRQTITSTDNKLDVGSPFKESLKTDPHLHAHCFVFNATHDGVEDKWKAGQFRQVKQDAPYYEAYFHSKLAEKLEAIGYNINKTENGFEIAGIEKETLDKFSRRTKEIEEYANDNNITDDKQKAQIGARTREAKRSNVDAGQETSEWKERLTHQESLAIEKLKTDSGGFASGNTQAAKEAVNYSLNHHLERKSVASDKEILATAIKSSIGKATPEQVKKEFRNNEGIISVKQELRTFITTKDALSEEQSLIKNAISFKGKFSPINEGYEFKSDILNSQQKNAVKYALSTSDGITVITGKAGTGKTTLMTEVKQGINETGKKIFSYAPSSEASRVVQRSEGFDNADTLASLIANRSKHHELNNQVIWIDEAGMVSNRDMNKVFEIAKEQNARVILSGDTRQHNSVERGDAMRVIQKYASITPITVNKIQRQKNSDYRQAVKFLSDGNVEKGFRKLENIGAIKEVEDSKSRIKAVANDYYDSTFKNREKQNVLVIAPTHAEGALLTNAIRDKLKENKQIGGAERSFDTLKSLQFTEAQKQKLDNYKQGQVLAFHQNIAGIKAGSKLEVLNCSETGIFAKDGSGKHYEVPLSKARNFNVFENRKVEIAAGDKIRITGNGRALDGKHLYNGTTYDIAGFDKQGNIKLSNGSKLSKDYGYLTHGYVTTSHASQGKTADKVIISQSSMSFKASSMEQFYVSVSRGRQSTAIYTDDKASLMKAVSHSVQRQSATELLAGRTKSIIEQGRLSIVAQVKAKAKEAINKLIIRDHGLQEKNRAGQAKHR